LKGPAEVGGAYQLDGERAYLLLDRSVFDYADVTVSVWVKPDAAGEQPIWFFGADEAHAMSLSLDEEGRPQLVAVKGTQREQVRAGTPLPTDAWTLVTFTLAGDDAALYVGSELWAQGTVTVDPDDVLAPNTGRTPQHSYLGRDPGEGRFKGALGGLYVYSTALSGERIAALANGKP
jgi:Concanavalin A-like lectin/glucanases superfamily